MGYMDMLKDAIGIGNSEPKQIDSDGKHYTFTPGPNGSLTAPGSGEQKPLVESRPPVAKTLPANKPIQVAGMRG